MQDSSITILTQSLKEGIVTRSEGLEDKTFTLV